MKKGSGKPIFERLLGKIEKTSRCWIWNGTKDIKGYGVMKIEKKMYKAHRLVYELFIGSIPKDPINYHGTLVMHKCDNPSCVNPDHLFLGTAADNAHDRDMKGRTARQKGSIHGGSKLTESQVIAIRKDPRIAKEISKDYGVSRQQITGIKLRKAWKHI